LTKVVINPTHELLDEKSAVGKPLMLMRLLKVSEQDMPDELEPTTVKVMR